MGYEKIFDITDELTPCELDELPALANEPADENTVSLEEYKKVVKQWRIKRQINDQ